MTRFSFFCLPFMFTLSLNAAIDFMDQLPTDQFLGGGEYISSDGSMGYYQTYVSLSYQDMTAHYAWQSGHNSIALQFYFAGNGYFDVAKDGYIIGNGYCMSFMCHYNAELDGANYHEVLSFHDNMLFRIGDKTEGEYQVRWEEKLYSLSEPGSGDPSMPVVTPNPIDNPIAMD